MTTLTRKQREIKEREGLILDVARSMLIERGYLGLSMDRIAEEVEYSKGTIYQHFRSKEDLLAALSCQTKQKRVELFERAATFAGRPRERITAIGLADEIFVKIYPDYSRIEEILLVESIVAKASKEHQEASRQMDGRCLGAISGILYDAISRKDLDLPQTTHPHEVAYGLWSMSLGSRLVMKWPSAKENLGFDDFFGAHRRNQQAYLDGLGWALLSSDHDYEETRLRVAGEVFSTESKGLV